MRLLLFILIALSPKLLAQVADEGQSLSMIFIGDVMQHKDQITSAYNEERGAYEYDTFKYITDIIDSADIAIANLEFTMAGPPYSGYPQFCAPDEVAVALKEAGVDVLVTANNHSCDRRRKGVIRTIEVLDSLDIQHTGTFKDLNNKKEAYPLILEKKGFRIALLNYTYGTNGIPVPKGTIVELIDRETINRDIQLAKSYLVDKIIVFMHWGLEYQQNPSSEQKSLAQYCLDVGADYIIGSHPHVLQRFENSYNGSRARDEVVAYSLGNFVSHQRTRNRDGGAILQINLTKRKEVTLVESVGYYLTWVHNPNYKDGEDFYVLPASKFEQNPGFLDQWSYQKMKVFIQDSRRLFRKQNVNVHEYVYDVKSGLWSY